jgi:hypothetical protein
LVDDGLFKYYGVAVWNAFILDSNDKEYISLKRLVQIAQKVGGENHKFRYIQTPFNIAKTQAYSAESQIVGGKPYTLIGAAKKLGIDIIGSSSLLQMNLFKKSFTREVGFVLDKNMILENDIQLALQFVRSTSGLLSGLFASKVPVHIKNNIKIASVKAIPPTRYNLLYRL